MTPEQATALISAVATLATAVAGLLGAVVLLWRKVDENHKAINGRVTELVATARVAGHAEGVVLGQELAKGRDEEPDIE